MPSKNGRPKGIQPAALTVPQRPKSCTMSRNATKSRASATTTTATVRDHSSPAIGQPSDSPPGNDGLEKVLPVGTLAEGTNRISHRRRLRPECASTGEAPPSSGLPADWEGDHPHPPAGQLAKLSAACEPAALLERLVAMFLTADEGPVPSGRGEAASKATLAYILAVDTAVRDLWLARAAEIKRRCASYMPKGLLDQQEVFGFALADGLGRPLIPGDRARDVGQAGDDAIKGVKGTAKKPGPLPRAKEAAREAMRKATKAAEKDAVLSGGIVDAERNGEAAIGLVLDKTYDLKLPNETVGAAQGGRSWRRSVVEWRPPPSLLLPLAGATHGKNHLAEGAESTLSAEAVAARIAEA